MDRADALRMNRTFITDTVRLTTDFRSTDQNLGRPAPAPQKPAPQGVARIDLIPPEELRTRLNLKGAFDAIADRQSRRRFTGDSLKTDELSFLLWATQGVRRVIPGGTTMRTVPSAGARHSFETYLFVFDVDTIEPGLYRYLAIDHALVPISTIPDMRQRLSQAAPDQTFVAEGAVTFVWTTLPERMEWRYSLAAHRVILIDIGHVCQNLYTACEALSLGTCAVAAYHQELMDDLLGVDGSDEFTIYLAPAGTV